MKVYLASSFELKDRVEELCVILEQNGHEITMKWWHYDYKQIDVPDETWYCLEKVKQISQRNFEGIKNADALVLVSARTPRTFNGANIELGYAIALGKKCYSLGKLQRSAMYVPIFQCMDTEDLLRCLVLCKPETETQKT